MHVHIDFLKRHVNEKQSDGIDTVREDRTIAFGKRAADQTIAHEPSVDEKKLRIS